MKPVFDLRGYYITFMRTQSLGLAEWQQAMDCVRADGGNTVILWMGGGFRSKKYPITWQYNREHQNIQRNFVGALIDDAHAKGIRVLLALTPFSYDGVNQYPLEHPELRATQRDGSPASLAGIHCMGYNLCPAKAESQRFMLEYAREMIFDFYPHTDGLMIESSDYAICFCPDCGERYFEREYEFVETISQEVWRANPQAIVAVYPHYFTGQKVPGFQVAAAKQKFNPRWSLSFTAHSAHIEPELIRLAQNSIWWDSSPTLGTPSLICAGAQYARDNKVNGYLHVRLSRRIAQLFFVAPKAFSSEMDPRRADAAQRVAGSSESHRLSRIYAPT